jgi:hypothetical protein
VQQSGNNNSTTQDADSRAQRCVAAECEQGATNVSSRARNANRSEQERGVIRYGDGSTVVAIGGGGGGGVTSGSGGDASIQQSGNQNETDQAAQSGAQTCDGADCVQNANGDVRSSATNSDRNDQDAGSLTYGRNPVVVALGGASGGTSGSGGDGSIQQSGNNSATTQDADSDAQTCLFANCNQHSDGDVSSTASNSAPSEQQGGAVTYGGSATVVAMGGAGGGDASIQQSGNRNAADQTSDSNAESCTQSINCNQDAVGGVSSTARNSNTTEQEDGAVTYGRGATLVASGGSGAEGALGGNGGVQQSGNSNGTAQDSTSSAQACDTSLVCTHDAGSGVRSRASNRNRTEQEEGAVTYGGGATIVAAGGAGGASDTGAGGDGGNGNIQQSGNDNQTSQGSESVAGACFQATSCTQTAGGDVDSSASNANRTEQEDGNVTYGRGAALVAAAGSGGASQTSGGGSGGNGGIQQSGNNNGTDQDASSGSQVCGSTTQCNQEAAGNVNSKARSANGTDQDEGEVTYGRGAQLVAAGGAGGAGTTTGGTGGDASIAQSGNNNETDQTNTSDSQECVIASCQQQAGGNVDSRAWALNGTEQEGGEIEYGPNATLVAVGGTGGAGQTSGGSGGSGSIAQSGNHNATDHSAEAGSQRCGWASCTQGAGGNVRSRAATWNWTEQEEGELEYGPNATLVAIGGAGGAGTTGGGTGGSGTIAQSGNANSTEQRASSSSQECLTSMCVQDAAGRVESDAVNRNATDQDEGEITYGRSATLTAVGGAGAPTGGAGGEASVEQSGNHNDANQAAESSAQTCDGTSDCTQTAGGAVDSEARNANRTEQEEGEITYGRGGVVVVVGGAGSGAGSGGNASIRQSGNDNQTSQTAGSLAQICNASTCTQSSGDVESEAANFNRTEQEDGEITYGNNTVLVAVSNGGATEILGSGNSNQTTQTSAAGAQSCSAGATCTQSAGHVEVEANAGNQTEQEDGSLTYGGAEHPSNRNQTIQTSLAFARICDASTCTQDATDFTVSARVVNRRPPDDSDEEDPSGQGLIE